MLLDHVEIVGQDRILIVRNAPPHKNVGADSPETIVAPTSYCLAPPDEHDECEDDAVVNPSPKTSLADRDFPTSKHNPIALMAQRQLVLLLSLPEHSDDARVTERGFDVVMLMAVEK